jgi:hypothetical protein
MKRLFLCIGLVGLLGGTAPLAWSQALTSLRGTVSDQSGAVVPGAKVTLTNLDTGISRVTSSGSDGVYELLQVLPGRYRLTAEAPGFRKYVRENIELLVNTPTTVNVALEVGHATEVVSVSTQAPVLNTSDATLGNGFNELQVNELPIESRNVVDLLSLQAGVTYLGNRPDFDVNNDSRSGTVNGVRSDQANVTLDGVDVNDYANGYAFTSVLRMTPDSLEEFRVTTTNADAEQGSFAGAEVSLVTKSGTNKLHGVAYEYNRNTALAANDYFIKLSQLAEGQPDQAPKLIRNIFGGSLGGPIKKDRAFFFLSYDERLDREGESVVREIPSATLRQGIVQYEDVNGNIDQLSPTQITAMDPLHLGPDPVMLKYFNTYPLPNDNSVGDGLNFSGFRFAGNVANDYLTAVSRFDVHLNRSGTEDLFLRANWMDDTLPTPAFLPATAPEQTALNHSNGFAVGLISNLSPSIVNSVRWGLTRQSIPTSGDTNQPWNYVRELSQPIFYSHGFTEPVHNIGDDITWTKGKHSLQLGGSFRILHNPRLSQENSFSYGTMNASWLNPSGIANTGTYFDPAANGYPAVDPSFSNAYDFPLIGLLGMVTEVNAVYNYDRSGNVLPQGAPTHRDFIAHTYGVYGQDSWRLKRDFTVNLGLRWEVAPAPYDANGLQVVPNVNMQRWFNQRALEGEEGVPSSQDPLVSFELGGPANKAGPMYPTDYGNWAPRVSFAYSPHPKSDWLQKVFGNGKTSIRAGFGMTYYHFGEELLNTFDHNGAFGLSTNLSNPASVQTEDCAPRVTSLNVIPVNGCAGPIFLPAPKGTFPATPPFSLDTGGFAIDWGLDNMMKTPYVYQLNFTVERELANNLLLRISYVGSLAHRLLGQEDLAQPLNLRDPATGITYYQAASHLSQLGDQGIQVSQITPQIVGPTAAYWNDIFPLAAGMGYSVCGTTMANCSALQAVYDTFLGNLHNETSALFYLDLPGNVCPNGCSKLGPYTFFNRQFSSLYAWRTMENSNYHAMQVTLSKRFSKSVQADFNWTWSRSMDLSSDAERIGPYGGFDGEIMNAWDPNQLYGPSDFNATHQINANWLWQLPFGHGRKFGSTSSSWVNALLGGWQLGGIFRWTTGFPYIVDNGYEFPTDWQEEGLATQVGPLPKSGVYKMPDGTVNIFQNPSTAFNSWNFTLPGYSGTRNVGNGGGFFNLDASADKTWKMPWGENHTLELRVESFNLTNTPSFDSHVASWNEIDIVNSFGKYTSLLNLPREFQIALRYQF